MRDKCIKLDNSNVQVAPYQALPVLGGPKITHHRAAALDVIEPCPDMSEEVSFLHACWSDVDVHEWQLTRRYLSQERMAAVHEVIQKYMKKLCERTNHHMG